MTKEDEYTKTKTTLSKSDVEGIVIPVFDLEAVYDEEISPLMKKIIEICKQHEMPMVASFCYRTDEEGGNDAANTNLPFGDRQPERLFHAGNAIYGNYDANRSFTTAITVMKG